MSEFERKLPPYRLADIQYGDTLPRIAAREMGDANRWPELVWINRLTYPYLTGDEPSASSSVLLYGTMIKVPAPIGFTGGSNERGQVYERDCGLVARLLEADDAGDLLVVSGVDNLKQQLSHAIATPRGQATRHPEYGCMVWRLIGKVAGPTASKMAAEYVKATLKADYRVSKVDFATAEVVGDSVRPTARAIAIDGSSVDVKIQ